MAKAKVSPDASRSTSASRKRKRSARNSALSIRPLSFEPAVQSQVPPALAARLYSSTPGMRGPVLRLAAVNPLWSEVGIHQPDHRLDQRTNGIVHVLEVDVVKVVTGLVIVGMQAEAGDGLRDHTLLGQRVIVGPAEEMLLGMRIAHQLGAMGREFGA